MIPSEKFLVNMDGSPYGAILRVAIGVAVAPLLQGLSGEPNEIWIALGLFVGLLIMLRAVPALLRRVLPFSSEAREIWARRRNIAKQFDSYQWHKLFWIGLGLLLYEVVAHAYANGELAVTVICLIGGGLGFLAWSAVNAKDPAKH